MNKKRRKISRWKDNRHCEGVKEDIVQWRTGDEGGSIRRESEVQRRKCSLWCRQTQGLLPLLSNDCIFTSVCPCVLTRKSDMEF